MDPFAALADPVRRDLLRSMHAGPRRVVDLADGRSISRPAVSKHLRVLAQAGLVCVEERGRERHYRLDRTALEPVRQLVSQLVAEPRPPARGSHPVTIPPSALDGLELEVRRAGRDRRDRRTDGTPAASTATTNTEDTA